MNKMFFAIGLVLISFSCSNKQQNTKASQNKMQEEVRKAEKDFETMAGSQGIREAFVFFADSNAVIKRGKDSLIHGKQGIDNFYSADSYKRAKVNWSPDVVEVSSQGDLAWTYGKYKWVITDSSGKHEEYTGIFHTVWKRQADGSWKYVWD